MPSSDDTVSARVSSALAERITDVFGVMGNGNAYFLDALERSSARYTAVRHEAGAVVAADAYFRASGRIAAATTSYGPGFTNALTALAESAQARIPLVLVVGAPPSTGARPWDLDQGLLAAAVGAPTVAVGRRHPERAVAEALDRAVAERGPIVLAIPYDLAAAPSGGSAGATASLVPASPAPLVLDEAAERGLDAIATALRESARPHLLAGRGAWLAAAGRELGQLAERLGATTSSTALGRGIFPDDARDLGVTGGFGEHEAMEVVAAADVAVVFGASLNQFTMRFGALFDPGARVIQVDVADAPTHPRVDFHVRADARLAAEGLARRLGSGPRPSGAVSPIDAVRLRTAEPAAGEFAPDGRLDPRALATRIGELLPDDRIVVTDGGHFLGWPVGYWSVASPERMMMVGTAFQSIGMGLPSMVGAARARQQSTIVLASGDGGTLMALADLESAVRVAAGRGLAVIWNDAAYGAEITLYGAMGLAEAPMLIPEVDFAGLATALGAEGVAVERLADLDRLAQWSATPADERRFLLLDCRVSNLIVAPYQQEIVARAVSAGT